MTKGRTAHRMKTMAPMIWYRTASVRNEEEEVIMYDEV